MLRYIGAFKICIGIWWYGLDAGFVPVMMAVNCVRLMKHRTVRWDRTGRFVVILDPRGHLRTTTALAIAVMACWLLIR
jgi:hypothetical protein